MPQKRKSSDFVLDASGEEEVPVTCRTVVHANTTSPPDVHANNVERIPPGNVNEGNTARENSSGKAGRRRTGKKQSFRVGRVGVYLRGSVWYLCYWENGRRRRPRAGRDRDVARRLAAEVNAQLEGGAPSMLSFERVSVEELRDRWLRHHEFVRRSSVHTIRRYRAATDHLLRFVGGARVAADASRFSLGDAEEFVAHLRSIRVSPNGHEKTKKRGLLDKGVLFIIETCRALFSYAARHRHLSPYAENPFASLGFNRMPIEDAKPIRLFTPDEERRFLEECDDWQFPIFLTLIMTGLRSGELSHLLLPDDLDLDAGILRVTNKPDLGWQVKTRSEREIPLSPILVGILRGVVDARSSGPVFLRKRIVTGRDTPVAATPGERLASVVSRSDEEQRPEDDRGGRLRIAKKAWWASGAITNEIVRRAFMRITRKIGLPDVTAPKTLRHMFATCLQDANVDPLIRMELMGHAPQGARAGGPLGMTSTYTHTRPATRRGQLLAALEHRPCTKVARARQRSEGMASRAG